MDVVTDADLLAYARARAVSDHIADPIKELALGYLALWERNVELEQINHDHLSINAELHTKLKRCEEIMGQWSTR